MDLTDIIERVGLDPDKDMANVAKLPFRARAAPQGDYGHGRKAPLTVDVLRELGPGDVMQDADGPGLPAVQRLRESHHRVARLVARELHDAEISAITGMDLHRVNHLRNKDPAFRELVSFYRASREEELDYVKGRLHTLSLDALAEIQSRLDDAPETFSLKDLQSVAELSLDRTGHGPQSKVSAMVGVLTGEDLKALKEAVHEQHSIKQTRGRVIDGDYVRQDPVPADRGSSGGSAGHGGAEGSQAAEAPGEPGTGDNV